MITLKKPYGIYPLNAKVTFEQPVEQSLIDRGLAALTTDTTGQYVFPPTPANIPLSVTAGTDGNYAGTEQSANLKILAVKPYRPFCEIDAGKYLVTDDAHSNYVKQLSVYTGDIVAGDGTFSAMISTFNWNNYATYGPDERLFGAAGEEIGGGDSAIQQVWKLSTGTYLMMGQSSEVDSESKTGKRYLHRLSKSPDFKVGTIDGLNNRFASLNFGSMTSKEPAVTNIHALHQRSLCDAKVGASRKIIVAEYNVASNRITAGKDQVTAWISVDDGCSFKRLIRFNTNGTHEVDHFHAVVQNPHTGIIYFLTGDEGTENCIISWDGVSPAPVHYKGNVRDDNGGSTTLAALAATPGWTVSSGNELRRFGDLVFMPDGRIVGLPDSDNNPEQNAFAACAIDPSLRWVASGKKFTRIKDICPLIALRCTNGALIYGSLRTQGTATADEPYHHFWTSVDGETWYFAAKVKNQRLVDKETVPRTANVLDLWQDSKGNVIAGVTGGRGASYGGLNTGASCVIFQPTIIYGPPLLTKDV